MSVKLPKLHTEKEITALLNSFDLRYRNNQKQYLMMKVCLNLALRVSELINLKIEDIDLMTGEVFIQSGKGNKDRIVYLRSDVLEEVKDFIKEEKRSKGLLFLTRNNKPYDRTNLDTMIKRRGTKLDIPREKNHFHNLRHYRATEILRKTGNLLYVQKILGHSNIQNTVIYTHLANDDIKEVMTNI